jgi:hypothetical protein
MTPKSKRGLAAWEAVRCSWMRGDKLAKNQRAEITVFQMSEVQESPAFSGRQSILTLRRSCFPLLADFAQKTLASIARFVEQFIPAVAVETDGRCDD